VDRVGRDDRLGDRHERRTADRIHRRPVTCSRGAGRRVDDRSYSVEMADEVILNGGVINPGVVVRVGNTVRRPRVAGSEAVEALLLHLERVGFEAAPRFLGHDERGRQVLQFIEGGVCDSPVWQDDDRLNAANLGRLSGLIRELHSGTESFVAPSGVEPQRPLPIRGAVWTHGDAGYANTVYVSGRPSALIDWEFAAPADRRHDLAALLAMDVRGPRPGASDAPRRAHATKIALDAIAAGYGLDDNERAGLPDIAAAVLDDAAAFWGRRGNAGDHLARMSWRARWFRSNASWLVR